MGYETRASWREWFHRWDGDGIFKGLDTPIKTERMELEEIIIIKELGEV